MARSTIAYEKPKNSFEKFLEWTNEKEVLAKVIEQFIKPSHRSLLDVGAGNGDLTAQISHHFKEITLLEPSIFLYEILRRRFSGVRILNSKVEDFRTTNRFDFILASHVFIYVENPDQIINKLYSILKENGILLILMLDQTGGYLQYIDRFAKTVFGKSKEADEYRWEDIVKILKSEKIKYQTKDVATTINAPSMEAFLGINDFHFNTGVSHLSENTLAEMKNYLHRFEHKNSFSIDVKHKFIVIER